MRAPRRRRPRSHPILRNALAALLCLVTLGGVPPHDDAKLRPLRAAMPEPAPSSQRQEARSAAAGPALAALFDRRPMLAPEARAGLQGAPLGALFPGAVPVAARAADIPPARPAEAVRQAQIVPLPLPRPAELLPAPQRLALRRAAPRLRAAAPAPGAETPSFFEELFAARKDAGPALAYAALEGDTLERSRGRLIPAPEAGAGIAVYDISARTVRLPGGEVLEAHSGLGASMDHPDFVHLRMRGSTPPGTYDLTEREALFHGVRAIRLNPVGGSAAIHGRDGLLAHTYMLGPSGASNGCVSFRNYDRFLRAYLRGEIRRLVVVSGRGDGPARLADRR